GMGKTALVLNVARHAAVLHQKAVGIFSLEMSSTDLVTRLLCAEAEVDAQRLRSGNLPDKDYRKLHTSVNNLHKANIFIDETAGLNILDLRARARRLKAEHNVELLIIDYLQLINASVRSGANRQEEVALISRSLKALAKELSIPVIALSQLSRAVEQRGGDKRPQLSDLRDSGSIEQDADVVMFIHREDYYNTAQDAFNQSMVTEAEIIIAKHRNGPTDTAKLGWARKFTKFVPMDTAHTGIVPPPSSHDVEPAF
ncbi:MAG TPA: DnaB-like helicase C-terminal domain-containing protein, partial [bacterium]|nr:DnaB-like helicase C-terminal domain-containing protein [bacterium]